MRQEFQLKLYFAQRESQDLYMRLIAVQRTACQLWLEKYQSKAVEESKIHSFAWRVDQYRLGQIQAMLAWLDLCVLSMD